VKNSSQIDEIFDTISYAKGASIIRMLHSFIGEEAFKKGMLVSVCVCVCVCIYVCMCVCVFVVGVCVC